MLDRAGWDGAAMAEWVFSCWSCREDTDMDDKVRLKDECPHCRADMHSCKNCQYYDPGAHNQCAETISEYVPDKERSNFCGMFTAFQGEREGLEDSQKAMDKLNALFGK